MRDPKMVRLDAQDPALIGVQQYLIATRKNFCNDSTFGHKQEAVLQILAKVPFNQCVIFTNDQER